MAAYCVAQQELSLLFMTRGFTQPGYPTNLYSIVTSRVTKLDQYYKEVDEKAKQVLKATGVQDGLATIQFIRDRDGIFYATEMGHRLSADMIYEPFEQITGFDAIGYMLDTVEGHHHTKDQLPPSYSTDITAGANAYMFFTATAGTIQTIRGLDQLQEKEEYIVDMVQQQGDQVPKHSVIGKVVFKADDTNELCERIDTINKTLQITNEKGEDMIVRFTHFDDIRKYIEQR